MQTPTLSSLLLSLLAILPVPGQAKSCPHLTPPSNGVLKCQKINGELQCMATCYQGHVFDTQEEVVIRTCDHVSGMWEEGNYLPVCSDRCDASLLSGQVTALVKPKISASSDNASDDLIPLYQRVSLTNGFTWYPDVEDMAQFVQVEFATTVRINGVVLRGDLSSSYTTAFRLLFSEDGKKWYPYADGNSPDKIFLANTDSVNHVTRIFQCPHEARFVRMNPILWSGHLSVAFDILGCALDETPRQCKPVEPPVGGAVNCEIDGEKMQCTAYCLGENVFPSGDPVLSRTCYESVGPIGDNSFPDCTEPGAVSPPRANVSGYCMEQEIDCDRIENGDYQYCGDCHFFATCSHGYIYIRACPALLKFDAAQGVCDYTSRTCQSRHRRLWLAEQRMDDFSGTVK